ncbi:hypothetical protein NUSPORA_02018 [Nucleospora cyclopteri]
MKQPNCRMRDLIKVLLERKLILAFWDVEKNVSKQSHSNVCYKTYGRNEAFKTLL